MPGEGDQYGFVVRKIDADFLGSAKLGDLIEVKTTLADSTKSTISLLQEVYGENKKLFSMTILLVYIENGKPRRIPETFRDLLTNFQD